jgi:hypothetical protein
MLAEGSDLTLKAESGLVDVGVWGAKCAPAAEPFDGTFLGMDFFPALFFLESVGSVVLPVFRSAPEGCREMGGVIGK